MNQWCKYVMVATIPVPIVKDLAGAPEEPLDHEAEVKDVVEIEEEKEWSWLQRSKWVSST